MLTERPNPVNAALAEIRRFLMQNAPLPISAQVSSLQKCAVQLGPPPPVCVNDASRCSAEKLPRGAFARMTLPCSAIRKVGVGEYKVTILCRMPLAASFDWATAYSPEMTSLQSCSDLPEQAAIPEIFQIPAAICPDEDASENLAA